MPVRSLWSQWTWRDDHCVLQASVWMIGHGCNSKDKKFNKKQKEADEYFISTFVLDPPPPHLRLKSLFLYKYKFESSYQSICWTCYLTQTSTWHGKAVWLRGWTTGTIPTQINNHKSADTKAMNNISNYKKQNHAMEFFDFDLVKTRTKIKTLQKTGWFVCHHCLNDTLCNSWQGGCSKPRVETPPVNKKKII